MPAINHLSSSLPNLATGAGQPGFPERFRGEASGSNRARLHSRHTAHVQRCASESPAALIAAPAVQPPQYPLKDFFRKPDQTLFRLSSDGSMLAFKRPVSVDGQLRRMNIFVQPMQGTTPMGEPRKITSETARDIDTYVWKGTDTILYTKDFAGDENTHLVAVNARSGTVLDLTPYEQVRASIKDELEGDPDHILVEHNQRDPKVFDLYRINVHTGASFLAARNPGNVVNWWTDHTGKVRAALTNDNLDTTLLYRDTSIDYSRRRKVLTVATYQTDKLQHEILDPLTRDIYRKLAGRLQGYDFIVQHKTREEDKFIVSAFNDRTYGARYVYDVRSDTLAKLADVHPALSEADMAPVRPITFQSRDGLTLHGYLTLPVGRPAKNLPVIVNPHGGPWARDSWCYNPEVQLLANRGFGVLQVNFRGSTGYGTKFREAGFGQWGLAMQDDITDGVQWLISQGIADPKRVGIFGGSYGGYATLAGITFTPDLYAAAVDYVGVSNLFTFLDTIPPYWKPMLARMYDMIGHPEKDKERLIATSPALHVANIKTPLFIAQGANDPRVKRAESDQMVQALLARGVEVEYMVKDNEGHGFRNEENRLEFYAAVEKFFTQHLKPALDA